MVDFQKYQKSNGKSNEVSVSALLFKFDNSNGNGVTFKSSNGNDNGVTVEK